MNNTIITYSIAASTNNSDHGCVYLYVFDNETSFQKFLNLQNDPVHDYYQNSTCISEGTIEFLKATNITLNITKLAFIYIGLIANDTTFVEANVSIQLFRYLTERLTKANLDGHDESVIIDFYRPVQGVCLNFNNQKYPQYCILVQSSTYCFITYTDEEIESTSEKEDQKNNKSFVIICVILFFAGLIIGLLLGLQCKKCCSTKQDPSETGYNITL